MSKVTAAGVNANGWYTSGHIARLFGVDVRTVSRWRRAGKLAAQVTLGGRLRFRGSEVQRLIGAGLLDQHPPVIVTDRDLERRAKQRLAELSDA